MSQSISLYEVAHDLRVLLDADDSFDPETGELSPELQNAIGALKNKGAAVVAYILNKQAESEMIGGAITKMVARKKAAESRADALKRYLAENMKHAGVDVIEAQDKAFAAKLYLDRDESIVIDDEKKIDRALCRVVPETTAPDKAAIKAAIKSGQPVAGARIVRRDRLVIA